MFKTTVTTFFQLIFRTGIFIFLLSIVGDMKAQTLFDAYGLKSPDEGTASQCNDYFSVYKKMPKEVRYGVNIIENEIYFSFNSRKYYDMVFENDEDGILIAIVTPSDYACNGKDKNQSPKYPGYFLPPLYKKDMKINQVKNEPDRITVKYGTVPFEFNPLEIECNLVIIKKKYICHYYRIGSLDFSEWQLLPTGLFKDSIALINDKPSYHQKVKQLQFILPFKKNEASFDPNDIQPLLDSLAQIPYKISELQVRAYTSIEGTRADNKKLEQERVKGIVAALQIFQKDSFKVKVSGTENWHQFIKDIKNSRFNYLKKLGKAGIKEALKDQNLLASLEPTLKSHRKAKIKLKLIYCLSGNENDPNVLKNNFHRSIKQQQLAEAMYLQNLIYQKVKDNSIPEEFAYQLEIPEEAFFGQLINNQLIFGYENNKVDIHELVNDYKKINKLTPSNPKIQYNLTALHLQQWAIDTSYNQNDYVKLAIKNIEKMNWPGKLVDRLWVNYYIIKTRYYHQALKYDLKDNALRHLYSTYKESKLNDEDLLRFAKYISFHSQFEWATHLLQKRAMQEDTSEDLIFYYLRLTIGNPANTTKFEFAVALENGIKKSNRRFCELFLPKSQGGYTFQLLDDPLLMNLYCTNCNY